MQYQSFPDAAGPSRSIDKLSALRLPALSGKRFLDVGCNEGFFCGFAQFSGASRVVGIDQNAETLQRAAARFPEVTFLAQGWDQLPDESFDVITLLSALHYAEDQEALIHRLMDHLTPEGVLVLEIGLSSESQNDWVSVKRSIDTRLFPTRSKLNALLKPYAWKIIGNSVEQPGDPLQRVVVHVTRLKPYAYLMLESPASGKSTLARQLFEGSRIALLRGDGLYLRIAREQVKASARLLEAVQPGFKTWQIDRAVERVFSQGLYGEFFECLLSKHENPAVQDIAIDSYVPKAYWPQVMQWMRDRGYFPVLMSWEGQQSLIDSADYGQQVQRYQQFLSTQSHSGTVYKVSRKRRSLPAGLYWHLDSPVDGQLVTPQTVTRLVGWICFDRAEQPELVLELCAGDQRLCVTPDRIREDVWSALGPRFKQPVEVTAQVPVGFSVTIDSHWFEDLRLSVRVDGERYELARITLKEAVRKRWFGI